MNLSLSLSLKGNKHPGRSALPARRLVAVLATFSLLGAVGLMGLSGAGCKQSATPAKFEKLGNLKFHRSDRAALSEARKSGKRVFFDFYAHWCVNCKLWAKDALRYKDLNQALAGAVLVKVYDTDPVFAKYRKKYKELQQGLPFFLVLNPDGSLRWKTQQYKDHAGMIRALTEK